MELVKNKLGDRYNPSLIKDLTFIVSYKRNIEITDRFSIIYGFGLMYGYHGKLQNTNGIPFRKSFLFTGDAELSNEIDIVNSFNRPNFFIS